MFKKGLSHLEFVISFVIFIGFIAFVFIFFNPLSSQRTIKSTLDYAWIEVSQEAKEVVETYSVSIDSSQVTAPIVAIAIPGVSEDFNASIEDVDGNPVPASTNNGVVSFDRGGEYFFRIRYSSAIANSANPISGLSLGDSQYYISSSNSEEMYIEESLINLNESYFSDYNGLKQRFNLPNRMEFGFAVDFDEYRIFAVNDIPNNAEVLSKSDRVEVLRKSGKLEHADVMVLVW